MNNMGIKKQASLFLFSQWALSEFPQCSPALRLSFLSPELSLGHLTQHFEK